MKKNIIISGSLAYDRIMDFPGRFSDHILPEKIHMLNIAFQVDSIKEKFGGTAGNIAYALRLLGENPVISGAIGHDYRRYFEWFAKNGIATDNIKIIENDLTAGAYITTDKADNQITGFHPGAMKYPAAFNFSKLDPKETIVIVSPGNLDDMLSYPRICKTKGIDYIFDPGQSLPMLEPGNLAESIKGCLILIANDYELEMIIKKTGLQKVELLKLTGNIIVTQGESGSLVSTPEGEFKIPAVKPAKAVDPTGAGDAYRGGLLSGLVHGKTIWESAMMGSVCASFCVEHYGTQDYRFSKAEFEARLASC
jgi:adenosine kinase